MCDLKEACLKNVAHQIKTTSEMPTDFCVLQYYSLQKEKIFMEVSGSSSAIFSLSCRKFTVGNCISSHLTSLLSKAHTRQGL